MNATDPSISAREGRAATLVAGVLLVFGILQIFDPQAPAAGRVGLLLWYMFSSVSILRALSLSRWLVVVLQLLVAIPALVQFVFSVIDMTIAPIPTSTYAGLLIACLVLAASALSLVWLWRRGLGDALRSG